MTDMTNLTRRPLIGAPVATVLASGATADILSAVTPENLPASKRTPLGLYLTPSEAYRALLTNSDILLVDVRDSGEITFVSHPGGLDNIIPLRTTTHVVDTETGQYATTPNTHLVDDFSALFALTGVGLDHPLFVTCRSGSRSATATRKLVAEGLTNVWNLIERFEGDSDDNGVRVVNGWPNVGLPWSYRLEHGVAWQSVA